MIDRTPSCNPQITNRFDSILQSWSPSIKVAMPDESIYLTPDKSMTMRDDSDSRIDLRDSLNFLDSIESMSPSGETTVE